jgi:hypothetical protein
MQNPSCWGSVSGALMEKDDGGGWWGVGIRGWWWFVRPFENASGGGGLGQKPETEPPWLGFGSAVSTAVEGSGGWWGGGSHDATAGVGRRVLKREAGEGVWGRIPETEPPWLGFRSAVTNSGG